MTRTTQTDAVSRRDLTRRVLASGAVVMAPSFVSVAQGATSSGNVEIETTATVPSSTAIDVRVFEDLDDSGTADNQQEQSISDGTGVAEYAALAGAEAQAVHYWMEITLSTTDGDVTPELDSMTITLPESPSPSPTPTDEPGPAPSQEPQGIDELWDNFLVFVAVAVGAMGALAGLASKSMALGAFAAYMTFAFIAIETGHQLLTNILYVTLVLIIIGMAFKLWRLEFGGST